MSQNSGFWKKTKIRIFPCGLSDSKYNVLIDYKLYSLQNDLSTGAALQWSIHQRRHSLDADSEQIHVLFTTSQRSRHTPTTSFWQLNMHFNSAQK